MAKIVETVDPTWRVMSAGDGAKGPHVYDWARVPLLSRQLPNERWLLLRRGRTDGQLAYYLCHAPPGTPLAALGAWRACS